MKQNDAYRELIEQSKEQKTAEKMIKELNENYVSRDPLLEQKLPDLIGELADKGIEIGKYLNSSRRIVFEARYGNKRVVVKFSHALHTIDHDEKQQRKEEMIWDTAKRDGDQDYFAEILFSNLSSMYVVQEYCEDIERKYDDDSLEEKYAKLAQKYSLHEITLGRNSWEE